MLRFIGLVAGTFFCNLQATLFAQMADLHGDFSENRHGIHDGNQFRISFYNDGTWGTQIQNIQGLAINGEWPL